MTRPALSLIVNPDPPAAPTPRGWVPLWVVPSPEAVARHRAEVLRQTRELFAAEDRPVDPADLRLDRA